MHRTLLYPLPGRTRSTRLKGPFQGFPRIPKLPGDLRKRISMWKRILLAELPTGQVSGSHEVMDGS